MAQVTKVTQVTQVTAGRSRVLTVWTASSLRETPALWAGRYSLKPRAYLHNLGVNNWHSFASLSHILEEFPQTHLKISNFTQAQSSWQNSSQEDKIYKVYFQAVSRLDKAVTSVLILATLTSFCYLFWYQNFTEVSFMLSLNLHCDTLLRCIWSSLMLLPRAYMPWCTELITGSYNFFNMVNKCFYSETVLQWKYFSAFVRIGENQS